MEMESPEIEVISLDCIDEENETSQEIPNWEDICRVCANVSDHMIPIYENEGAEHKLSDKIHRYLPIEVSKTDRLPLKLCFHCASTVLAWHEVITGCLQAEEKLLQMLTNIQRKEHFQLEHQPILSSNKIIKGIIVENGSIDFEDQITTMEIKTLSLTELTQKIVAQNELVNDPETTATQILKISSVTNQENLTSLNCEQEESCTTQQLEEISENLQQSRFNHKTTKRCGETKQTKFATFSTKKTDIHPRNGTNLAHAKVSDHLTSGISGNKLKTNLLEKTTNSSKANTEFSCKNCCRRFLRESNLKSHAINCCGQQRTKNSTFPSKETHRNESKIANNEENLENHCIVKATESDETNCRNQREIPKKIESPSYSCLHCELTLKTRKLLNQHTLEHHPDLCDTNEEKNQRIINRNLVRRAKMEVNGRVYYHCNDCGKNLFSTSTFIRHVRIHTGERPFICHLCGKQFRINQGLLNHLRDYHAGIKKFSCDLCGRMFSTKQYVDDHRRIHTGERPYVCDICGKTFKQKSSLYLHNRTHSDVFPFNCSYCGQKFRSKAPLEIHLKKHTGEKPYTCDICDRAFRIQYDMKLHRLIHFDEKPWKCSDCGHSFRRKRYLINHKKINLKCTSTIKKPDLDVN